MSDENEGQVNSIEDRAREMGWKPQDEYEGDAEKWVNAEVFVSRKPLFDKIEQEKRSRISVEKQLEQTNKALRELGEHNKKIAELAYQRAKKELSAARKEALREGDVVLADEIQDRIAELKPEPVPEVPEVNPMKAKVEAWIEVNQWYKDDLEMRSVADGIANAAINQGKAPEEVFEIVEQKIKKMYKEKFEVSNRNPNKDEAPPVESRTAGTGKKPSKFRPTEEQRRFAKAFAASGAGITEEDYYKQLEELGE